MYVKHDSCMWNMTHICETWLIYVCDESHLYVICVTRPHVTCHAPQFICDTPYFVFDTPHSMSDTPHCTCDRPRFFRLKTIQVKCLSHIYYLHDAFIWHMSEGRRMRQVHDVFHMWQASFLSCDSTRVNVTYYAPHFMCDTPYFESDTPHILYETAHFTCDTPLPVRNVSCHMWHVSFHMWHVSFTCDTSHFTYDTSHVTCDTPLFIRDTHVSFHMWHTYFSYVTHVRCMKRGLSHVQFRTPCSIRDSRRMPYVTHLISYFDTPYFMCYTPESTRSHAPRVCHTTHLWYFIFDVVCASICDMSHSYVMPYSHEWHDAFIYIFICRALCIPTWNASRIRGMPFLCVISSLCVTWYQIVMSDTVIWGGYGQ